MSIAVAIPLLAELDNLPSLLDRMRHQSRRDYTLYLCINNEEDGYGFNENQACLKLLNTVDDLPLVVIDRSSPGLGWSGKKKGVGWARKVLFDTIAEHHADTDIVVSLDADTDFDSYYLEAIHATFIHYPKASAIGVPYYHPLSGIEQQDRAMLRYECYMRHYLINLLHISNPYAFTALGSAIAFPLWAYKKVGGITPLQGGEDFYLMQKFAKTGTILKRLRNPFQQMVVRPQGRVSSRVPFGTGPAIAKGVNAMDDSYPFYNEQGFAAIKKTYDLFDSLYDNDIETPMSDFLRQQLSTNELWNPLRKNYKKRELFIHACSERVNGLRILQFLKNNPQYRLKTSSLPVDFIHDSIEQLDSYRNQLFNQEMELR